MKKNIDKTGRIIRFLLAIFLFVLAWWFFSWILLAFGIFTLYEALAGWCVYYQLIGKNTCPSNNLNNKKK